MTTEKDSPRFIVICGPELSELMYHVIDYGLASEKIRGEDLNKPVTLIVFPEREMGAQKCRDLVDSTIENGQAAIFITRYEHTVCQFALSVYDGNIKPNDIEIWLMQKDEHGEFKRSTHSITSEGVLGNDWPFGVLF